eukprot:TRINITY_DN7512_c0_g1_i1.p1 TRINITY_DN7512_c0_g1~~TRINITY_DN7512_c0_g1_i1.p1  ORF type:complete len:390 (-),score=117.34 TRINITY_DN7512_c0_g1_i1:40-1209(-)
MDPEQATTNNNHPTKEEIQKLETSAKKYFEKGNWNKAADFYSQLLEINVKFYGDDRQPELAELYRYYGEALLEGKKTEIFSGNVKKKMQEKEELELAKEKLEENQVVCVSEKAESKDLEIQSNNETINSDTQINGGNIREEGKKTEKNEKSEPNRNSNNPETEQEESQSSEEDGDEDEDNKSKTEDPLDTLEIAWEVLELSRLIYSKDVTKNLELSDVHLLLGNVALEGEQMELAIEEYIKSLKIREDFGADERRIAESHFQLGLVYTFLPEGNLKAQEHYRSAKQALSRRIDRLRLEYPTDEEQIDSLNQIIIELDGRILEVIDSEEKIDQNQTPVFKEPSLPSGPVNTLIPRKKPVETNRDSNKRKLDGGDEKDKRPIKKFKVTEDS